MMSTLYLSDEVPIGVIPDICPFWYTFELFWPFFGTPKSAQIHKKIANIGQNFALSMLKSTMPPLVAVVSDRLTCGQEMG